MRTIRIATRKSLLALWQANYVRTRLLEGNPALQVVLLELLSEGDKTLDVPLSVAGGKGLFLKELEQSLLRGEADLAVHSMKDVPVALPDGLEIAAICQREDPRDVFVSHRFDALEQLPAKAVIGTCSLRRQCQLRAKFPHLHFMDIRGNVHTRLDKLNRGECDGLVLAAAGLKRLQLEHRINDYLAAELCLPAVGQGAIGIECRADDAAVRALIAPLNHADSALCVRAERAANERLDGGCHVPLAVFAELNAAANSGDQEQMRVRALVGKPDGTKLLRSTKTGVRAESIQLAHAVAEDLLAHGAGEILDGVYGK